MIKIIAGKLKGRKLSTINIDNVRPTQAKVRKSMMDSIRTFENKTILDLFSGAGTLGIEAISRGAKKVKFIDNNNSAISILKKNILLLDLTEKSSISKNDAMEFLKRDRNTYDIIFADPPYRKYKFEDLLPYASKLLNENGLFCFESNRYPITIEENDYFKIKKYGNVQVAFWRNIIWK